MNRFSSAPETLFLRVAGKGKDILDSHPGKRVESAFEERAVTVLAGDMSDRCQAVLENKGDKSLRRKGRVTAWKVGDADDSDPAIVGGGLLDESLRFRHLVIPAQDELGGVGEAALSN